MCSGDQLTADMGWVGWWVVVILHNGVRGEDLLGRANSDEKDILGDEQEKNTTYEALPIPEEWRNAPNCPLWGPMDSFYKEGIENGRVG